MYSLMHEASITTVLEVKRGCSSQHISVETAVAKFGHLRGAPTASCRIVRLISTSFSNYRSTTLLASSTVLPLVLPLLVLKQLSGAGSNNVP